MNKEQPKDIFSRVGADLEVFVDSRGKPRVSMVYPIGGPVAAYWSREITEKNTHEILQALTEIVKALAQARNIDLAELQEPVAYHHSAIY